MVLLLIQMKYFLDLVAQSLAIGRLAVAAVLLLVYVSGSTSAGVELVLRVALIDLRNHVY